MSSGFSNLEVNRAAAVANPEAMPPNNTSASAVTPPLGSIRAPTIPMAQLLSPNNGALQCGSSALDLSALQASMDAMDANVTPFTAASTTTAAIRQAPVFVGSESSPTAPVPKARLKELRDLYLAGFRAAVESQVPTESSNLESIHRIPAVESDHRRSSSTTFSSANSSPPSSPAQEPSGRKPFPRLVMEMLSKEDPEIIAWGRRGDAFSVRDVRRFEAILPNYFRSSKIASFQRNLNLYGFQRIKKGPETGYYQHELFHRDRPEQCSQIKRSSKKQASAVAAKQTGSPRTSVPTSPVSTPDGSPNLCALEQPLTMAATQCLPGMIMAPPQAHMTEGHRANFRTSPSAPEATAPLTGLSLLMSDKNNGGSNARPAHSNEAGYSLADMTEEQRQMVQDDLVDREHQARALGAAGMAVETVDHQPPQVAMAQPPPPAVEPMITDDYWSLHTPDDSSMSDTEMDFGRVFDPDHEAANLQAETSRWPATQQQQQSQQEEATAVIEI